MPTYILNLLISSVSSFSLMKFIENIFFLPQIIPNKSFYNYVSWTLGWEWIFYIIIFVIAILTNRNKLIAIIIGAITVVVMSIFSYSIKQDIVLIPDGIRFSGFFIGCLLSEYYPKAKSKIIEILGYFSLPSIFIASYVWGKYSEIVAANWLTLGAFYIVVDILTCLLIILLLNHESAYKSILNLRPLRIIGQISYTFYLTHSAIAIPISNQIYKVYNKESMMFSYLLTLFVTFLVSSFLFYLTERQYLKNKISRV